MAPKATVYKAELQISDMDRHYYASHQLTLAQHPSETDQRLMARVLAFALFADERLEFGRGISDQDDPDLWRRDYTGEIEHWIDLGQPTEADIRKACGRARQVVVISYSGNSAEIWWQKTGADLAKLKNLTVLDFAPDELDAATRLLKRGMNLTAMIQDGELQLIADGDSASVTPRKRMSAPGQ